MIVSYLLTELHIDGRMADRQRNNFWDVVMSVENTPKQPLVNPTAPSAAGANELAPHSLSCLQFLNGIGHGPRPQVYSASSSTPGSTATALSLAPPEQLPPLPSLLLSQGRANTATLRQRRAAQRPSQGYSYPLLLHTPSFKGGMPSSSQHNQNDQTDWQIRSLLTTRAPERPHSGSRFRQNTQFLLRY